MDHDLEVDRRERAEVVWRKRMAGERNAKIDPLTSEAMVAQVEVRMSRLQSANFHEELAKALGREAKEDEVRVIRAMAADPAAKMSELAKIVGSSESRVKRISLLLQKLGIVNRVGTKRRGAWKIQIFGPERAEV